VVVAVLVGLYGSQVVRQLYLDDLTHDLEARARLCGKPIGDLVASGQNDRVDAVCKELGQATNTRITVVLPSGEVIGDSNINPHTMDNHKGRPEIRDALAGGVGQIVRYSNTEQEERIYVAVALLQEKKTTAVVRTSVAFTALTHALGVVRDRVVLAALAGVLLHAVVSWVVARRMSRPLEEIKAGAERFAAGELHHRLPTAGTEEVAALAEALNRMAEQLDERIQTVLRQQNEREAMLSSMEEGVLAVDNESRILSLNQTCAKLLGGTPEKFQGRTIYEAVRKAELLEFIEKTLAGAAPLDGELQIRGPQERWVSAHGTALHDPQRGPIGVLVVLHDVTRLRHLEDVRRDFVANVSHELRTPITSIKGFVETLLDGAMEDHENASRFLQIMLRQVNRLDAIISDLLALSRIERSSDEQMIELANDSIAAVLHAAVEMCEKKAAAKQIQIVFDCPVELFCKMNAALMEQAVVNLLDNAIKYSDSGSTVDLTAGREGDDLIIRVKDQGCGIEAKHLPRLFERFYRVDKARSRDLGGTGLGLAIVRHIALAHRGSVGVESTVGVGSTFSLRLPLAPPNSVS
jgi:two-component system phosphate regulon sensor histidine kinase PhoR